MGLRETRGGTVPAMTEESNPKLLHATQIFCPVAIAGSLSKVEAWAASSEREIMPDNQGGRRREPDRSTLPPPQITQAEIAQPMAAQNAADRSQPDFGAVDYPGRPNEHGTPKVGENATANERGNK
jgi:hypothetical protein